MHNRIKGGDPAPIPCRVFGHKGKIKAKITKKPIPAEGVKSFIQYKSIDPTNINDKASRVKNKPIPIIGVSRCRAP